MKDIVLAFLVVVVLIFAAAWMFGRSERLCVTAGGYWAQRDRTCLRITEIRP